MLDTACSQHAPGSSQVSVKRSVAAWPRRGVCTTSGTGNLLLGSPASRGLKLPLLLLQGEGARAAPESLGNRYDGHESGVQAGDRAASCSRSQMRSERCVCGRAAVGPTVASCSHTCTGVLAATATCHSCVCNAQRHTGQNSAPHPAAVWGGAFLPPQTLPQPRPLCCLGCAEPRDLNPRTGDRPPPHHALPFPQLDFESLGFLLRNASEQARAFLTGTGLVKRAGALSTRMREDLPMEEINPNTF